MESNNGFEMGRFRGSGYENHNFELKKRDHPKTSRMCSMGLQQFSHLHFSELDTRAVGV
jgi:hypothetical protein